jgi:hypothetical protein
MRTKINILVTSSKDSDQAKENLNQLMDLYMKGTLKQIRNLETEQ